MAVVFEDEQLTYRELNQRANQLGHHLQSLGVGPEVLVGICVERSLEMVVGLLGILKAGGAYVPLDPNYPQERLSYMLEDSQLTILLTQHHLLRQLPQHQKQTICLDKDWQNFTGYSQDNSINKIKSNNLAYVIYTSGSTSKPKGTMVLHSGMVNYLSWCKKTYNVTSGIGSIVNSSISFDATITSLFSPLLVGLRVVLLPEKGEIEALKAALSSGTKFSLIKITPAHLEILNHLFEDKQVSIQTQAFIIGGEALSGKITSFWKKYAPAIKLINEYGPTETVVGCCVYEVGKQSFARDNIPIGRPIANTQIYILDSHLKPVPIGVPGELHIGGDGLARGYLNREELTDEKFIPNPFGPGRLYKTGDKARYLADGNIEYLGRLDNQVKIRGFRIELGEIEAVLNTQTQVQQSIVVAHQDSSGNQRLVAYVVASDESGTPQQLRDNLKQKLPEYMVPSLFMTLDSLPLTPNGKIDRQALPAPDGEISRSHEYVAPRNPSEEILANIFADLLKLNHVGINDNFFEIGGHSLLATQLVSRVRQALNLEVTLKEIFVSPTIAQLEPRLREIKAAGSELSLPPVEPRENGEQSRSLPLSWAQERLWFLNQLEGTSATYNMPGAIRLDGDLDISALERALSEIVRRHEVLRTSFSTIDGELAQIIDPNLEFQIEVIDLTAEPEESREAKLMEQAQVQATNPFDLETAPLIRLALLLLSESEVVLLFNMHHIVSDGWSRGILVAELSSLYRAFSRDEPSPLDELAIQYADFALWQRQFLSGEVLSRQLSYWKQELAAAPELLQLPTERPRPSVQSYRGQTQSFSLDLELTHKLIALSQKSGVTLFMTLQAAFATLLSRYSAQTDITLGSPIANRNRREIESLIGLFVNTLVLRTRFEDNPSFEELLSQVRETTLRAYEHQDVPFEMVVEELQPQRSLSHSPLFQVMFVFQNTPMEELELPGVRLSPIEQPSTVAKFDLTLSMSETERGLVGSWEYATDLFEAETIERMATHFENMLASIVDNPQQAVGELPLLSPAERHQLLVEWNDTQSDYPQDKCIHHLFESQVAQTPDAVAVVFEDEQLTYRELNQRANQLGHHLQSLGVGPEVLVGICVERSLEMVVGLLGILKAGGAYVPLDPNYPQERLSYMLTDSGVELLLTQNSLLESFDEQGLETVCLDPDWQEIGQHSHLNLDLEMSSTNLAYVIYTSGSTGQPKGIQVSNRSVVNFLNSMRCSPGLTQADIFYSVTTISFDIATLELYLPLIVGAKLIVAAAEITSNGERLLSELIRSKTTIMQATPATWQMSFGSGWSPNHPLKVLCGGEALSAQLATQILRNGSQLWNLYGPTETTIWSTIELVEKYVQMKTLFQILLADQ